MNIQRPAVPRAILSAASLYALWTAFGVAASIVLPLLAEIAEWSPRLAWLGGFALWLSPIPVAALAHHTVGKMIDVAARDRAPRASMGVVSLWTGVFAWCAMFFCTTAMIFISIIMNPPPPPDPDGMLLGWMHRFTAIASPSLTLQTFAWLAIAAGLYQIEGAMKARLATEKD